MGAYLSEPVTNKQSEDGEGNNLRYGASCMQGWRVSQEDAHNCIANFDKDASLFAVYDGHGGSEVAIYLSRHFPECLKNLKSYQDGNWEESLKESYLKIDASIPTNSVIVELQKIAKQDSADKKGESATDYEEENVNALYEEATMPLEKLVALYQSKTGISITTELSNILNKGKGDQPCSSKAIQLPGKSTDSEAGGSSKAGGSGSCEPSVNSAVETEKDSNPDNIKAEEIVNNSTNDTENVKELPKPEEGSNASTTNQANNAHIVSEEKNNKVETKTSEPVADSTTTPVPLENGSKSEDGVKSNSVEKAKSLDEPIKNGECESPEKNEILNIQVESNGSPAPKPRKGKVHPSPVVTPTKEESPKKTRNRSPDAKVLSALTTSDSDSSEESDDYVAGMSDSDDDEEDASGANSSSTENGDEEGDDDEDDDDDEEDDEEEADDQFLNDIQEPGFDSGSTAVVAFLKWQGEKLGLWVANAGDSRCVVCRNGEAVEMSFDHKPEEQKETRRIVAAGGKVTHDGRVNGGLNLSRAIGDHSYKQNPKVSAEEQMITPLPDIMHLELDTETDSFIVMACDGIWNSMSSQEVVDFVSHELKSQNQMSKICEKLFEHCLSPDTSGDGTGCDNMTAIIINLSKLIPSALKRRLSNPEAVQEEPKKAKVETDV